jgi:hypothetical protein
MSAGDAHAPPRSPGRRPRHRPARAFPPSTFRGKNRCGIGKSQPKWTASKLDTPRSPTRGAGAPTSPPAAHPVDVHMIYGCDRHPAAAAAAAAGDRGEVGEVWVKWVKKPPPRGMVAHARCAVSTTNIIEAPWLVNGGHGASLKHHVSPASPAPEWPGPRWLAAPPVTAERAPPTEHPPATTVTSAVTGQILRRQQQRTRPHLTGHRSHIKID